MSSKIELPNSNWITPSEKTCITCFYLLNQAECYFHKSASYQYSLLDLPKPSRSNEPTVQHRALLNLQLADSILPDSVNQNLLLLRLEESSSLRTSIRSPTIKSNNTNHKYVLYLRLQSVCDFSKPYCELHDELQTSSSKPNDSESKQQLLELKNSFTHLKNLLPAPSHNEKIANDTTTLSLKAKIDTLENQLTQLYAELQHINSNVVKVNNQLTDTTRSVRGEMAGIQAKLNSRERSRVRKNSSPSNLRSLGHLSADSTSSQATSASSKTLHSRSTSFNESTNLSPILDSPDLNKQTRLHPTITIPDNQSKITDPPRTSSFQPSPKDTNSTTKEIFPPENSEDEELNDKSVDSDNNVRNNNLSEEYYYSDDSKSVTSNQSKSIKPTDRKSASKDNITNWIDYLYDRSDRFYRLNKVPKDYTILTDVIYNKYVKHTDNSKEFKKAITTAINQDIKKRLKTS